MRLAEAQINNDPASVQVVGRSRRADDFVHAFFWRSPGPMVDLGTFGGGNSYAADINDRGQIAGSSEDASRRQWAAVWILSGSTWTIENLGTAIGACCAHAQGINNGLAGRVMAQSTLSTLETGDTAMILECARVNSHPNTDLLRLRPLWRLSVPVVEIPHGNPGVITFHSG